MKLWLFQFTPDFVFAQPEHAIISARVAAEDRRMAILAMEDALMQPLGSGRVHADGRARLNEGATVRYFGAAPVSAPQAHILSFTTRTGRIFERSNDGELHEARLA